MNIFGIKALINLSVVGVYLDTRIRKPCRYLTDIYAEQNKCVDLSLKYLKTPINKPHCTGRMYIVVGNLS